MYWTEVYLYVVVVLGQRDVDGEGLARLAGPNGAHVGDAIYDKHEGIVGLDLEAVEAGVKEGGGCEAGRPVLGWHVGAGGVSLPQLKLTMLAGWVKTGAPAQLGLL